MKVLISDKLGKKGVEVLEKEKALTVDVKPGMKPDELKAVIGEYNGIVIRSGTKLTKDILAAATNLKVIGRAGVGVDNVDLDEATKRGIIVMNTPGGNTVSTCEHSIAMLLSLSRNIPQANQSLKSKEWKRGSFMGSEVYGKTLGIIGFGRIGKEVAKRMASFGMKITVFDPFLSSEASAQFDVDAVTLDELCKRADYITIHTPKTADTKYLLNKERFALMKDGVRIVNCARGGIVNEKDLYDAITSGKVKGAALDVFENEPPLDSPLLTLQEVVAVPHLGASTEEAQENVGIAVAEQVADALLDRGIRNAVNMPSLDSETMKILAPWVTLCERIGAFISQVGGGENLQKVTIKYSGEMTAFPLVPLSIAVLKGVLTPVLGAEGVNYVNAPFIAKERGIEVVESKTSRLGDFANAIAVETRSGDNGTCIVGTLFGNNDPRIVRFNEFHVDVKPEGFMLIVSNQDKPGLVGEIGTLLGTNDINIAEMTLGRNKEGAVATTILNIDQALPQNVLDQLRALDKVIDARVISF